MGQTVVYSKDRVFSMNNYILEIIVALSSVVFSYLFYCIKRIHRKLDNSISEAKVRQIINDRVAVIEARQDEVKDDIKRLESKIDYLIDLLMRNK